MSYILSRLIQLIHSPGELGRILIRIHEIYKAQGVEGVRQGLLRDRMAAGGGDAQVARTLHRNYQEWIEQEERPDRQGNLLKTGSTALPSSPLISFLLIADHCEADNLLPTIESIIMQESQEWELWVIGELPAVVLKSSINDRLHTDKRFHYCSRDPKSSIAGLDSLIREMAGEYVVFLEAGAVLPPRALTVAGMRLAERPDTIIFYSDEDHIGRAGKRYAPYFKPDPDPLLLAEDYYFRGFTGVLKAFVLASQEGLAEHGEMCSYRWALALQALANGQKERIIHLREILCHRRSANDERREVNPLTRNRNPISEQTPLVSLIIPTRNGYAMLRRCLESIASRTVYANYEVVIVDNQSDEPESLKYLHTLSQQPKYRVLHYDAAFNYSAINNFAVGLAAGEIICFLNNDVEIISPYWLTEMTRLALQAESGAVGAMLYFPDDSIQHAGIALGMSGLGKGGIAKNAFCGLPRGFSGQGGRLRFSQHVSAVTGACMVIRKVVFEMAGGFDAENLPVTYNDVDLCLRLMDTGYLNVFTPRAELYHYESSSRGADDSAEKRARFSREVLHMRKRWGHRLNYDPYFPSGELSTCGWV